MINDAMNAIRHVRRHWGFSLAIVLSLAFGIGTSTTIFGLFNALLLRPLPVGDPGHLLLIGPASTRGAAGSVSTHLLDRLRDDATVEGACGFLTPASTVQYAQALVRVSALALTGDCFRTLRVTPALGRLFDVGDRLADGPKVAVISYDAWQREYGGNASVIGQTLRIEGIPHTIVGVTEERFTGLVLGFPAKVMYPLAQDMPSVADGRGPFYWVSAFLRRKTTSSFAEMQSHLAASWPRLLDDTVPTAFEGERRDAYRQQPMALSSAAGGMDFSLRTRFGKPLLVLLGISALVLVFSCVNVANLLLARGGARRQEMAIRLAMGATRRVLVRQLVVEGLLMVLGAVAAGLAVAHVGNGLLLQALERSYTGNFHLDVQPDGRVILVCAAAAALCLLIAGIVPAWLNSDIEASAALKSSSRSIAGASAAGRRLLIVSQVALALILLTGALRFVQTLMDLRGTDLGFQPSHVLSAQLIPAPGDLGKTAHGDGYRHALLERIAALPGVDRVCFTNTPPMVGTGRAARVSLPDATQASIPVISVAVTDKFFQTLGLPLRTGNDFSPTGGAGEITDAIVSESLARKLFPDGAAPGRQLRLETAGERRVLAVTAVAGDAKLFNPREDAPLIVYVNYWQRPELQDRPAILVRTSGDPALALDTLRRVLVSGEGAAEFATYLRTMDAQFDAQLLQERLLGWLATTFGAIALGLAAVGLFGLLSYLVASRTPEIGIRLALGASPSSVRRLVVREATLLVGVGVLLGIPATVVLAGMASHVLQGLSGGLWAPLAFVAALLVLVGLGAAWLPARRASRLGALEALRRE